MISRSRHEGAKPISQHMVTGLPIRLLGEERREVSRLEFHSLERPEMVAEKTDVEDVSLKEEVAAFDEQMESQAEQISMEVETARSEARAGARREWETELEERVAAERMAILKAREEFLRERARYFAGVEAEVVKLALAIAARVLHREAKLDPLLLSGVVRVALEKVADDSTTLLRVPVDEVETWRGIFTEGSKSSVELVGDERLDAGECVLDTNVGRVELGVSAQLAEIERGFFDLMQQRPA
jgi:flagellar assembly protein FliH